MAKKILLALAAVAAALLLLWAYAGGFSTAAPINRVEAGPWHIAYISHKGPYKSIGKVLDQLERDLVAAGVEPERYGGLFYDRPEVAGNDKCRSDAFAVISAAQAEKFKGHATVKTRVIERRSYLATSMPFRGMLSVIAGVSKVYPAYQKYWQANKLPPYTYRETGYENDYAIELYGPKRIFYYMTIPEQEKR
ncbi:MAG: GyrI-like domain-containing protein [Spirochaetota bacterium]